MSAELTFVRSLAPRDPTGSEGRSAAAGARNCLRPAASGVCRGSGIRHSAST